MGGTGKQRGAAWADMDMGSISIIKTNTKNMGIESLILNVFI
jgi:hypothetical protein